MPTFNPVSGKLALCRGTTSLREEEANGLCMELLVSADGTLVCARRGMDDAAVGELYGISTEMARMCAKDDAFSFDANGDGTPDSSSSPTGPTEPDAADDLPIA